MADNFLERRQNDYERKKSEWLNRNKYIELIRNKKKELNK
ncbi:MAG: dehydrogenase [Prevotella sp.]|nr:dehydrogenase [Prevotella sp.]MBO5314297.1 dehydrogenase [Prevotella sp.]MBQ4633666.1 dehydrogenase [Prevotella sp.]MBQ5607149.1 dehydrogenase [Prevotella sp.]MBQ8629379.1 dehydrogenase [Prevotella sp.]